MSLLQRWPVHGFEEGMCANVSHHPQSASGISLKQLTIMTGDNLTTEKEICIQRHSSGASFSYTGLSAPNKKTHLFKQALGLLGDPPRVVRGVRPDGFK